MLFYKVNNVQANKANHMQAGAEGIITPVLAANMCDATGLL